MQKTMRIACILHLCAISVLAGVDECTNKLDQTEGLSCDALFKATELSCDDAGATGTLAGMCDLRCGFCTPCEDEAVVEVRWKKGGGSWRFLMVPLHVDNEGLKEESSIDILMDGTRNTYTGCVAKNSCYEVSVFGGYQGLDTEWSTNLNILLEKTLPFYGHVCHDGNAWHQESLAVEISNTTSACSTKNIPALSTLVGGKATLSLTACGAVGGTVTGTDATFELMRVPSSPVKVHLEAQAITATTGYSDLFMTQWNLLSSEQEVDDKIELGLYASAVTDSNALISLAEAGETSQWLAAIIAMSDSYGDSWDGYDLRITNENTGALLFVGTVDADFAWGVVALQFDSCYLVDVTAGIFAEDVTWSLCNGTASGGAPARHVRFCVTADGTCIPPPPVPEIIQKKSTTFVNFSFSTVPGSSSDCGGPWPSRLELDFQFCSLALDAVIRDDRYATSKMVSSQLEHVSFDNDRSTALFRLNIAWKRASFYYGTLDDDADDDGCTPDMSHTLELLVDASSGSSGLIKVRVANGNVASVAGRADDRFVGASLAWNNETLLIVDDNADNSLTHLALMCPKHSSNDFGTTLLPNGSATSFVADCTGPNRISFAPPSASLNLCDENLELSCLENTCTMVYDPTFMSNGTLVAKASAGTVYINGVALAALHQNVSEYHAVLDCSQDMIRVAIEGTDILSEALSFRGCGSASTSINDWRCVPLDAFNWLTAAIDTVWPLADVIDGRVSCPNDESSEEGVDSVLRLITSIEIPSPLCADEMDSCSEALEWVFETQINDVDPQATLCSTDDMMYRCRAACGGCGSQSTLPHEPLQCLDMDLRLHDQGWGGDLDYELREIVPSRHVLKNATYFNGTEDTLRFMGTLLDNAGSRLCLAVDACYSFLALAGVRIDGIRWTFCSEWGSDNDEIMDVCIYDTGCERWLNRFDASGFSANATTSKLTALVDTNEQELIKSAAAQACHSYFKYQSTTLEGDKRFQVVIPRVTFKIDGHVVAEISAIFENLAADVKQGSAEPVDAGGATLYGTTVSNLTSHTGLSVDWLVGLECESENKTEDATVTLRAYWTPQLKQSHDNDDILEITLDTMWVQTSSTIPKSLAFGIHATDYAVVTELDEPQILYYRFFRLPGLEVISDDTTIRKVEDVGLVLADGSYTITSIPQMMPDMNFCDGVIPLTVGTSFRLIAGECTMSANEEESTSWLSFFDGDRVQYRGSGEDDEIPVCRGIDNGYTRYEVRVDGGTELCAASFGFIYMGQSARLVDTEFPGDLSITWSVEEADRGLCEAASTLSLEIFADYAYPWLRLSATASSDSPTLLGYTFYEKTGSSSSHFYTASLEQDDDSSFSTWREQFSLDCSDSMADTSSSSVAFRGVDQVELFVNGIFVYAGFGSTALFEQAALPIRCDGQDVLAAKILSHSLSAQFLAHFEIGCEPSSPLIIETDSTWLCREYTDDDDDLSWTAREISDDTSTWSPAIELGAQPDLDAYPLPASGKWIAASRKPRAAVCRRIITSTFASTPKPSPKPTPRPTTLFSQKPTNMPPSPAPVQIANANTPTKNKKSTAAPYEMVAVIVGFAILVFIINVIYQPCRRCILNRCGGRSRREAELNEVMLSAFSPVHQDVEQRAISPPTSPGQRGSHSFLGGRRGGPSLAERVAALHRHDGGSDPTEHFFSRLDDHDDMPPLPNNNEDTTSF